MGKARSAWQHNWVYQGRFVTSCWTTFPGGNIRLVLKCLPWTKARHILLRPFLSIRLALPLSSIWYSSNWSVWVQFSLTEVVKQNNITKWRLLCFGHCLISMSSLLTIYGQHQGKQDKQDSADRKTLPGICQVWNLKVYEVWMIYQADGTVLWRRYPCFCTARIASTLATRRMWKSSTSASFDRFIVRSMGPVLFH